MPMQTAPTVSPFRAGAARRPALGFVRPWRSARESVSYFAPSTMAWQAIGMAIAACAIFPGGLPPTPRGRPCAMGRIGINALMTVAVTGASS